MSSLQGIHRRLDFTLTDALVRRFWDRVAKAGDDECWLWTASYRNGYGAIKHEKRVLSAHRVAYVIANGFPDPELIVGHKCDTRGCCNPKHLEAISAKKNNRDARDRVTFHLNTGEDVPNAVLTSDIVIAIRKMRKETGFGAKRIRTALGLTADAKTIDKVIRGETWKHIGETP